MALTRNFKQTVVARVESDPAFSKALLDEAATLFLSGEPETARLILRDLVNATIGFEQLAEITHKPSKSLHRMLSPKGNPSMDLWCRGRTTQRRLQGTYRQSRLSSLRALPPRPRRSPRRHTHRALECAAERRL